MKNNPLSVFNNKRLFPVWFALFAAAFIYGLYAFYYTFLDWTELLLVGLNSVLAGAGFAGGVLLCACAKKDSVMKAGKKVLIFAGGLVFFEALLFGILTVVNVDGLYNRKAIYIAYAVITVMFTAMSMILFIRLSKSVHKPLNALLASLCIPALLVTAWLPVRNDIKYWCFDMMSSGVVTFAPITAKDAS
ncbi:MAG: hypothetical protein MJ177_06485, partial [Clostridia bacterium]|nr:hypothetical protein [Clostridia bacterium]